MKINHLIVILVVSFLSAVAPAGLKESWTVEQSIEKPESAYQDPTSGLLYVSNIVGPGTEKDGKGWISTMTANGKVLKPKWVDGLNAPKGMRSHKGTLWVSDIDELVAIDIKTGKIQQKYPLPDCKFANDVAVGPKGEVYVSDMLGSRIYVLTDGKVSTFVEGADLESPNGLFYADGKLYVAAWGLAGPDMSTKVAGRLYSIDLQTKAKKYVTSQPLGNLDGLEADGKGNFFVSDWIAGKVFFVHPDGKSEVLVEGLKGAADLAFVPKGSLLVVPRMDENRVTAYKM